MISHQVSGQGASDRLHNVEKHITTKKRENTYTQTESTDSMGNRDKTKDGRYTHMSSSIVTVVLPPSVIRVL